MSQNIVPQDYVETNKIVRIEIQVSNVILKTSATFRVNSFGENDKFIKLDYITITGDEYNAWGSDDDYIINLICQKLGYTPEPSIISN
jgi:hypothetical protein